MCGIIGFYTGAPRFKINRDFTHQALYVGAVRGMHGTGVVGVTENEAVHIYKKAMAAADLLETKGADTFLDRMPSYKCVIGHNRFKTQGNVSNANTHPFQHGHITMVHNGSVATHSLPGNQEVDSDQIAHSLATVGIEKTIGNLNGAFALVWYDSIDKCMRIIRNEERPLWIGKDKNSETVYFASESLMLRWLAWRNGVELAEVYQPKPGTMLTFSGKSATPDATDIPLFIAPAYPRPNVSRQSGEPPLSTLEGLGLKFGDFMELHPVSWESMAQGTPTHNSYGNLFLMSAEHTSMFRFSGCRFREYDASKSYSCKLLGTCRIDGHEYVSVGSLALRGDNAFDVTNDMVWLRQASQEPKKLPLLKADEEAGKKKGNQASNDPLMLPGPGGNLVEEATYKKFIKHGCCMCGESLDIDDAPLITFDSQGNAYCDVCIESPVVIKYMKDGGN